MKYIRVNEGKEKMREKIKRLFEELQPMATSKALNIISSRLYKELPKDDEEFISLCNEFVKSEDWILYQMMTIWIKKRSTTYEMKYFKTYERWLYDYTTHWGACDQYCYRVLNPMIEKFPELFNEVRKWANSDKIYVKRASAVCLLKSTKTFIVNVPFEEVKEISDILIRDSHIHIQKGIGWLLKYAYLSYPDEVVNYLNDNLNILSRTTFRYALEKMSEELKKEMMAK